MLRSKSLIIIKIKYKTALMLSESEELSVMCHFGPASDLYSLILLIHSCSELKV